VSLDLPTLVQRRDDIPLLLNYFVQAAAERFKRPVPELAAAQLLDYQQREWRGNVRELRNFADRLVLGVEVAPLQEGPTRQVNLPQRVDAYEASLIKAALDAHAGNVALAAEQLGIPKKTLYDKMKKSVRD
jgi:two-component system C4-dicarboxylate transport response regulator DctD